MEFSNIRVINMHLLFNIRGLTCHQSASINIIEHVLLCLMDHKQSEFRS